MHVVFMLSVRLFSPKFSPSNVTNTVLANLHQPAHIKIFKYLTQKTKMLNFMIQIHCTSDEIDVVWFV